MNCFEFGLLQCDGWCFGFSGTDGKAWWQRLYKGRYGGAWQSIIKHGFIIV